MRIMLDLNVILDVVQHRQPHYPHSARVLHLARTRLVEAVIPAHALTTIHYVVEKGAGRAEADRAVDRVLAHFHIGQADAAVLRRARQLPVADFEDAVVAAIAEAAQSVRIVTRNVSDFAGSPVAALTPADFLKLSDIVNLPSSAE